MTEFTAKDSDYSFLCASCEMELLTRYFLPSTVGTMVDPPTPHCHLSVAASASLYFLFLLRLVLVYIQQQLADPLASVHL